MIDVRIRWNGVRVRLKGFGMKKLHNLQILETGLASVKERLARGVGSDDAPTAPLTKRYAIFKSRLTKRKAIRDLRLTGKFLDNLLPRYADDSQSIAYSSGRDGRMKAILYKDLISFSDQDQKKMAAKARELFSAQVTEIFRPTGRRDVRPEFRRSSSFNRSSSFSRAA